MLFAKSLINICQNLKTVQELENKIHEHNTSNPSTN